MVMVMASVNVKVLKRVLLDKMTFWGKKKKKKEEKLSRWGGGYIGYIFLYLSTNFDDVK